MDKRHNQYDTKITEFQASKFSSLQFFYVRADLKMLLRTFLSSAALWYFFFFNLRAFPGTQVVQQIMFLLLLFPKTILSILK